MTKKTIIFIIIILILSISNMFIYKTYAADSIDGVISGAQDFLEKGKENKLDVDIKDGNGGTQKIEVSTAQLDESDLHEVSNLIYNILLSIAIVLAVIIGMILGIQFMTASVEEKAKIKEALVPYITGCVIIFGAFGIWKLAVNILATW